MKVEIKITGGPTTGPTSFTFEMDKRQYSDPKLYIPKVKVNRRLHLGNAGMYGSFIGIRKPINLRKIKFFREMNRYRTVKERKQIGAALVKAYTRALKSALNTFSPQPNPFFAADALCKSFQTGVAAYVNSRDGSAMKLRPK